MVVTLESIFGGVISSKVQGNILFKLFVYVYM